MTVRIRELLVRVGADGASKQLSGADYRTAAMRGREAECLSGPGNLNAINKCTRNVTRARQLTRQDHARIKEGRAEQGRAREGLRRREAAEGLRRRKAKTKGVG